MKTKVKILQIEHCGCHCEGTVKIYLPTINKEILACYQGGDQQIIEALPIGSIQNVFLYIWLATVNRHDCASKAIMRKGKTYSYELTGTYKGSINIDDFDYELIDSELLFPVEKEFETNIEYKIGDYIKADGEFFIDYFDLLPT